MNSRLYFPGVPPWVSVPFPVNTDLHRQDCGVRLNGAQMRTAGAAQVAVQIAAFKTTTSLRQ
jgi:hypothetical protein